MKWCDYGSVVAEKRFGTQWSIVVPSILDPGLGGPMCVSLGSYGSEYGGSISFPLNPGLKDGMSSALVLPGPDHSVLLSHSTALP